MTQYSGDRGNATPSAVSLEREADAMNQRLDNVLSAQSAGRWVLLVPLALILGSFSLFGWRLVSAMRSNFNEQAVQAALAQKATDLAPQIQQRARQAIDKAMPVYRDQLLERVREAGPQIAEEALERFKTVPAENGKLLAEELTAMVDRVTAQIEPELRKSFPGMNEAQIATLLTEFKEGQVLEQTERLKVHVSEAITNELITLDQVMTKFEVKASDFQDIDQLKRSFVANLLDYAKYIVEYGGVESTDYRQVLFPALRKDVPAKPASK